MKALAPSDITRILNTLSDGHRSAAAELLPLIYRDLHALAERAMRSERAEHTLQPTALIHETYLRLFGGRSRTWVDRSHFFRIAAAAMRHVLVDHARMRSRVKRGGSHNPIALDEAVAVFKERAVDLVTLDEALSRLCAIDRRKAQVVELRFFAGLGVDETAEALGVSPRTVKSDWHFARLWLLREVSRE